MYFSIEVYRKNQETFVAYCDDLNVYSYGPSIELAVDRLKKVVQFYLDSADEMGLSLEELGLIQDETNAQFIPRVTSHDLKVAVN